MILTYHKIHPENKTIWWVTPDTFYRQMADLRSKKVVYLDDYDPADETQAVITFDGVYKEIWKYAVPILQHFGYPFELFVIGQTIGKDNSFDAGEPHAEFADVETLQKMVGAGGRLQWHSWSHARLAGTTAPAVYEKELSVPAELRQLCPEGFKWYAYPHGERDGVYRAQVESRFIGALACDDGNNADRYDLNRLTVYEETRLSNSTVSLIIPCYNYGHFAAEAIESALLQTYPPDEILFIDDASSDNSLEVARRYEPRIRVEANEKNLGVVENFRKAVEMTSGDYIVFLGADNRFRSDYVEQCKAILDAHPDVGIVYTHFALFGPRAGVQAAHTGGVAHPVAPGVYIKEFPANPSLSIREKNYIHGSSMYRRAAYLQAGGYIKEYLPEDNSLFARMLENGWKARLWNAPSLEYRHHSREQLDHLKSFEMENVYLRREKTRLENVIKDRENVINSLDDAVYNLEQKVAEGEALLQQKSNFFNQALAESEQQAQSLTAQLHEITSSKVWRVALLLRHARLLLLPPGSWRARAAGKLRSALLFLFTPRRARETSSNLALIRESGYFDKDWYLEQNPDVKRIGIDPVEHYLLYGGFEGRNPGPNFSSFEYLMEHPNLMRERINPLVDYLQSQKTPQRKMKIRSRKFHIHSPRLSLLLDRYGGVRPLIQKAVLTLREHGIRRVLNRAWGAIQDIRPSFDYHDAASSRDAGKVLRVIPYYLTPYHSHSPGSLTPDVGVHLHLYYTEMLEECSSYLERIPAPFSLYVSIPESEYEQAIASVFQQRLPALRNITVRKVPNRGRDIAPLIIEFGESLLQHQIIAHIHTKKSPHNSALANWFQDIMDTLFGSSAEIAQIWQLLLQKKGKFVYPTRNANVLIGKNGWGENYAIARSFAKKHFKISLEEFTNVEFPHATVFWATSTALKEFLSLRLRYSDFPTEPIPPDGTLAHALERLLLISANHLPGYNYCLHQPDSIIQEPAYEEARDYSQENRHPAVKIMTYYLPQFYPTPENDLWHGKGFTEWHKVRGINALFYGHYQQRAPHSDAGYYSLTSTEMFRKQALWMKQAGVHGQVFYHYWFSGKLILEKPTQLLLADPSIEIPFCFCWANENWTRRWDGNEKEILLQQNYSAQDAEDFIRYLIPFFQDSRYIRIEGRPVLFIYRPSSIPDFLVYQDVWERVCAENGLPAPYVVAVLTRGATSPNPFGMQAGVERVLHDWTDGNVRDIRHTLTTYSPLNGSVLDYNEVADYYMAQEPHKDFAYFRSIIPSWDNSPRYASEAFIIHNSSPQKFQQWLQTLIQDAEMRLPEDKRFILVNAWNEWAESAILDPDQRFGYAYLNSIGRALADVEYNHRAYLRSTLPPNLKVSVFFAPKLLELLQENELTRINMFTCLANSSLMSACQVSVSQSQARAWLIPLLHDACSLHVAEPEDSQYIIYISGACYFAPDVLETMAKMAQYDDAGVILPSALNDPEFTHNDLGTRWEAQNFDTLRLPSLFLYKVGAKRNTKYCVDAGIFNATYEPIPDSKTPVVSTIVRFHAARDIALLQNALYSLLAQGQCIVQPILAAQDLSAEVLGQIRAMLAQMPWNGQYPPIIQEYKSTETQKDLRAIMLNESLKSVSTPFAAFLDYDDVLFPHAYAWLLRRLQQTGKNASFGLIYTTIVLAQEKQISKRYVVYDYGKTYTDFFDRNHTPIHGFMLNLQKIDLERIEYDPAMKYMEDYYLALQIFTEKETDWESLRYRKFIGDYYHYQDKEQTLAISGSNRGEVTQSPDYIACEEQVNALRAKIQAQRK